MRVYHFTKRDNGLSILRDKRLKISRIKELNDPFEFIGVDLSIQIFSDTLTQLKEDINNDHGILCFSKNFKSPLLWAHYADIHKGLCLGFDLPDNILSKVKYIPERMSSRELKRQLINTEHLAHLINVCQLNSDEIEELLRNDTEKDKTGLEFVRNLLTTKFSHWSYEEEYRAFVPLHKKDGDHFFFNFSDDLILREVIFGLRAETCDDEIDDAIKKLQGEVKKFRVSAHDTRFELKK